MQFLDNGQTNIKKHSNYIIKKKKKLKIKSKSD